MDRRYPGSRGYVMPSEWNLHSGTLLAWPHNRQTWPGHLESAQKEFVALVNAILNDERVFLLAGKDLHESIAEQIELDSSGASELRLLDIPTNDAWIRDYGPTLVSNGHVLLAIDWHYNAWGGKYPPFDLDQQVVNRLAPYFEGLEVFRQSYVWKAEPLNPMAMEC